MSQDLPKEANITIVVRVRPRNPREIRDNSQIVVNPVSGVRGSREVQVRYNGSDTKTFTFDKVIGPEASQQHVFYEVVSPILDEVLMGYNCTIFAYGQTGAGKTYSMEGDLQNITGEHAGIIPRTLTHLFQRLESETAEYSVRVSYIELYNEELKDLLSADDPDFRKLRIFEDFSRKGSVLIQGLEESIVKNVDDVIQIMHRGSSKRQMASTKMNESSSRSHCIFSITVHIKEATPDGEDLLKVGKLNLVDLAGSENIGRSGAESRRAKEAGMINQSLLTLGRVINALVERSPHVPYRESKLTRLLQDSLGGRTKTCILAAISPARCSLDETLSTLDYAHRAKNIRNKPEINQKMTKKALIREYISEIERLKADLHATREKNGVFLASENYKHLVNEAQANRDRLAELEKAQNDRADELARLTTQCQQQSQRLEQAVRELATAQADVDASRAALDAARADVSARDLQLVERQALVVAHAAAEKRLDAIAHELNTLLTRRVAEIHRLHDKLAAQSQLVRDHHDRFDAMRTRMYAHLKAMRGETEAFSQSQTALLEKTDRLLGAAADQWAADDQSLQIAEAGSLAELETALKTSCETLTRSVMATLTRHHGQVDEHCAQGVAQHRELVQTMRAFDQATTDLYGGTVSAYHALCEKTETLQRTTQQAVAEFSEWKQTVDTERWQAWRRDEQDRAQTQRDAALAELEAMRLAVQQHQDGLAARKQHMMAQIASMVDALCTSEAREAAALVARLGDMEATVRAQYDHRVRDADNTLALQAQLAADETARMDQLVTSHVVEVAQQSLVASRAQLQTLSRAYAEQSERRETILQQQAQAQQAQWDHVAAANRSDLAAAQAEIAGVDQSLTATTAAFVEAHQSTLQSRAAAQNQLTRSLKQSRQYAADGRAAVNAFSAAQVLGTIPAAGHTLAQTALAAAPPATGTTPPRPPATAPPAAWPVTEDHETLLAKFRAAGSRLDTWQQAYHGGGEPATTTPPPHQPEDPADAAGLPKPASPALAAAADGAVAVAVDVDVDVAMAPSSSAATPTRRPSPPPSAPSDLMADGMIAGTDAAVAAAVCPVAPAEGYIPEVGPDLLALDEEDRQSAIGEEGTHAAAHRLTPDETTAGLSGSRKRIRPATPTKAALPSRLPSRRPRATSARGQPNDEP